MELTLNNVARVYSGKPGCMCGCKGKYSEPADAARSVKIMFNKVMNNPAREVDEGAGCVYVQTPTRIQAVYFNK